MSHVPASAAAVAATCATRSSRVRPAIARSGLPGSRVEP
ncbi:hypothetical protein FHY02_004098 [Sphingomonas sp. BK069]|nr:hypothetical protein [Sphingomonas sp. BK069]